MRQGKEYLKVAFGFKFMVFQTRAYISLMIDRPFSNYVCCLNLNTLALEQL